MCGIIGIYSKSAIHNKSWLRIGRDLMTHRGPDDCGEWWSADNCVGFGHRRLSIIDLSQSGHQPMSDSMGNITIVFNGEIYNHNELRIRLIEFGYKFNSKSDTEVIIAAYKYWGTDCLSHLNGMFAFAIFDSLKNIGFVARDRAGEKPLFYCHENGNFRFSSELKGLLADKSLPRNVNKTSLDLFLALGFVPDSRCILDGFHKLPAGHALTFKLDADELLIWQYWTPPEFDKNLAKVSDGEVLLDEIEGLLWDSVGRQMIADVPVGVLLSGGVDSSLVVALAAKHGNKKIKTFTVTFPENSKFNEAHHAKLIAESFNTDHLEIAIQSNISTDLLKNLAAQYDEPIADSSMIPTYLVCKEVQKHCKVVLGGDGGDELFGGYSHYSRLLNLYSYLKFIPHPFLVLMSLVAARILPVGFRGRERLISLRNGLESGLPGVATMFNSDARVRLMGDVRDWRPSADEIIKKLSPNVKDPIQAFTRYDFKNYLTEDILVKVDRASMLNSLEVRSPLLDKNILDFSFGKVPSSLKASSKERKILLKRLCSRLLPRGFDLKRKQGFSIPLAEWLRAGQFRNFFNEILLDNSCSFNRKAVQALFEEQDRRGVNSEKLFALMMFELWRRHYDVSIG